MISVILYANSTKYLNETLISLLDNTDQSLISETIVCLDCESDFEFPGVVIQHSSQIGKAKAYNSVQSLVTGEHLFFCDNQTKFTSNVVSRLIAKSDTVITIPRIYELNSELWKSEAKFVDNVGWRWDLQQYHRVSASTRSPSIWSAFLVSKSWLDTLGWFESALGYGEGAELELALKSWLCGGSIVVDKSCVISTVRTFSPNHDNLRWIVENWFQNDATKFYEFSGVRRDSTILGKFQIHAKQIKQSSWYLGNLQPELLGITNLYKTASLKSVAVVMDGFSISHINMADVYRHDLIIGVESIGNSIACDFVVAEDYETAKVLSVRYPDKLLLPITLAGLTVSQRIDSVDLFQRALVFESRDDADLIELRQPFTKHRLAAHYAIHFALYLTPASITIYGSDQRQPDPRVEYGYRLLGDLAIRSKIPMLRVLHA